MMNLRQVTLTMIIPFVFLVNSSFSQPATSSESHELSPQSARALMRNSWKAFEKKDWDAVIQQTNEVINLYQKDAEQAQNKGDPSTFVNPLEDGMAADHFFGKGGEATIIYNYNALDAVGTSLYVQGMALSATGKSQEAKQNYQKLIGKFSYAQGIDSDGKTFKPAQAAGQEIQKLLQKQGTINQ